MNQKNIIYNFFFITSLCLLAGTSCRKEQASIGYNQQPSITKPAQMGASHAAPGAIATSTGVIVENPRDNIETRPGYLGKSSTVKIEVNLARALDKDAGSQECPRATFAFDVKNVSGIPLFVTCFAYVKVHPFVRWRWRKSNVYEIKSLETITIPMESYDDYLDKKHVFGCLGVFPTREPAERATYQLLPDNNKLDLDRLSNLQGKEVLIGIERYGFREPFYDFDFVSKAQPSENPRHLPELDFLVENQTGSTVHICCFVSEKKAKSRWIAAIDDKDDMSTWRFYKTKVITIPQGATAAVDIDTVAQERDRSFVRGCLAIFGPDELDRAMMSTYELLEDDDKLDLGLLAKRAGKRLLLTVEKYGIENDVVNYTTKPVRWINFKDLEK